MPLLVALFRPLLAAFLPLLLATLAAASPETNHVQWDELHGPPRAGAGHVVAFTATVTNIGRVAWTDSHHLEAWDDDGTPITFVRVSAVEPGAAKTVTFRILLPAKAGTYRYHFQSLQAGVEYFGPVQTRTVVVGDAPANEPWTYVAGPSSVTEGRATTFTFAGYLPSGDVRYLEVLGAPPPVRSRRSPVGFRSPRRKRSSPFPAPSISTTAWATTGYGSTSATAKAASVMAGKRT